VLGEKNSIAKCTSTVPAVPETVNCEWQRQTILQFAVCSLQFAVVLASMAQDRPTNTLASREEAALRAAAASVADSVVQIRTIGGLDAIDGTLLADGPTSGLIISSDGYILSSAFNFLQQPASILVTFASGKQAPAQLVATDHSRMTVLLKVDGVSDLTVPSMVPEGEIRPGQWAIAVGRTFRADRTNITMGIVSALGRMHGKVIQTDADVSTANYGGPLVDIRGRVVGLIVPMAPQGTSEVAGVEWYDSGIGFAVPLAPLRERIERMKDGEDQRPGMMGIAMLAKNPHSSPAELATVRLDSPAGKAGLKKGDRIVELDGKRVRTQTDLRFALGTKYSGDTVRTIIERGGQRLERTVKLAAELPPFRHAFLGILPMRSSAALKIQRADSSSNGSDDAVAKEKDDDVEAAEDVGVPVGGGAPPDNENPGIVVRMVYPGSPAADGGVKVGDRIQQINEAEIKSTDDALKELNNAAPGSEVELSLSRGDETFDLKLTAARMPTSVPGELPPADLAEERDKIAGSKSGETTELKLPEFPNQCKIYAPASYVADRPQAALFWLHAPGDANADDVIAQWRSICDRDGVLLILPSAAESNRWERTELEYLRRLSARVISQYNIDSHRVVVYGQGGGGAMAWLLGLSSRDLFRGVATSSAPLPRQIRVPQNEPAQRLAVFAAIPSGKDTVAQVAQGLQTISEAGYPVTTITTGESSGLLTDAQREELARWIDALDRF
jgi:serine protease Do